MTSNITQSLRELEKQNLKEWMKKPHDPSLSNIPLLLFQISKQTEPLKKAEETSVKTLFFSFDLEPNLMANNFFETNKGHGQKNEGKC